MSELSVLRHDVWSGGLSLETLRGFAKDFLLGRGESVASVYPKKPATYSVNMSDVTKPGPERPGKDGKTKASTSLTDSLHNTDGNLVVSERLRALLAKADKKIEFLPVKIAAHKEPYFIANFLDDVACLDEKASKVKRDRKGAVTTVTKLAIKDSAVPKTRAAFRIKEVPDIVLVRPAVVDALTSARITGIEILPVAKFKRR